MRLFLYITVILHANAANHNNNFPFCYGHGSVPLFTVILLEVCTITHTERKNCVVLVLTRLAANQMCHGYLNAVVLCHSRLFRHNKVVTQTLQLFKCPWKSHNISTVC